MTENGPEPHEVPRDPVLKEAFDAFIQQTQVPGDFHARVLERVQQQRARPAQGKPRPGRLMTRDVQQAILKLGLHASKSTAGKDVQRIKAERLNDDSD